MSIGGSTYGEPILAKHADGHLEVFVIGLNGHLFRKRQYRPGQAFVQDWTEFPAMFHAPPAYWEEALFDSRTTRLSWALGPNGTMYVFARSARGRILYVHSLPTGSYSEWKSVAALQDGHPAMGNVATATGATWTGTVVLCARGKNGNVLRKLLAGAPDDWEDPNAWVDHGGTGSDDPVIGQDLIGTTLRTSIYVRALDHTLFRTGELVTGRTTTGFGAWQRVTDDRSPAARMAGQPVISGAWSEVLWRGINGSLWKISQPAFGSFTLPVDLHIPLASDPAFTSSAGTSWIFWQSPEGHIMMKRQRSGAGQEAPVVLTSGLGGVRAVSKPSVNTSVDGRVEVVFVGSDSQVYHLYETAVGSGSFAEGP